jgi:hypothetical protein
MLSGELPEFDDSSAARDLQWQWDLPACRYQSVYLCVHCKRLWRSLQPERPQPV